MLVYLAEKTGKFLPKRAGPARRGVAMAVLADGRAWSDVRAGHNHFSRYATDKLPYAIERYNKEVNRLYGVMNRRLADRPFLAGEYSIADMASYPWVVPHERQGQTIADFPHLKKWIETIAERPAVKKALRVGQEGQSEPRRHPHSGRTRHPVRSERGIGRQGRRDGALMIGGADASVPRSGGCRDHDVGRNGVRRRGQDSSLERRAQRHRRACAAVREGDRSQGRRGVRRHRGDESRIDGGEAFDVAILGPEAIDDLIRSGKALAAGRTNFGRTGLGVAVAQGQAPKPDISTPEALKRALLAAKSVAHSQEGQSGVHFAQLLDRLGIAAEMKGKLKTFDAPGLRQSLQNGEAEMAVTGLGPVLVMPGTDFVGAVPAELRTYVVFDIATAANARDKGAAAALLKFLTAPATGRAVEDQRPGALSRASRVRTLCARAARRSPRSRPRNDTPPPMTPTTAG